MTDEAVVAIAPIPLARARGRMLALPAVLLILALAAGVGGVLLGGWATVGMLAAATALAVGATYLALVALSVRMEVEVSTLRLRWIGVDRRFGLVRGAVTRVPLAGEEPAVLRARYGFLGWQLGPARLRGTEPVYAVRLAPTSSVILIPTEIGRVAVAPRSERQLIEALTAAARVQQRLDQVAARARAAVVDRPEVVVPVAPPPPVLQSSPQRVLTGIERVLLEERLAAERAAALAAAEAERRAAEEAARMAAVESQASATRESAPEAPPQRRRLAAPATPGWLRRPQLRLPAGSLPRDRAIALGMAALPLAVAMGLWGYTFVTGQLEDVGTEQEVLSLALALTGPAAALAALAARAWFPRLLGLVTVTSLCALVLVGRALIG